MAALARPAITAAAKRVAAALGAGAAAGAAADAARESARKRQEEGEKAKSTPVARTDAAVEARTKCPECPPDRGKPFKRSTAGWKPMPIAYQARIGGMPNGPGYLIEWDFNGVKFDGYVSAQCLLKEAKATYDQFFTSDGAFEYEFQERIFYDMLEEAIRQNAAATPKPPIALRWYFMEAISFRYMKRVLENATPQIEVLYQP